MVGKHHGYCLCHDNVCREKLGFVLLIVLLDHVGSFHHCFPRFKGLLLPQIFVVVPSANLTAGAAAPHPRLSKGGCFKNIL